MKPYDRLLEHNIKPSMQRIAIMEYLMEPILDKVQHLPKPTLQILAVGFMILLVGDFLVSFRAMYRHKSPNYLWKYDLTQRHLIHYHTLS